MKKLTLCVSGVVLDWAGVNRGGSGRKLQLDDGRAETRVKISEIRRCCTAVSWRVSLC